MSGPPKKQTILRRDEDAKPRPSGDGIKKIVTSLPVDHTGTTVYLKGWKNPEAENAVPVIIVHDLGEQTGYYRYVAKDLVAKGYNVYAFDQRGHGRSGRRLGHAPSFNILVKDLLQVTAWVRHKEKLKNPIIIGHGIGALVALDFINQYSSFCRGAILSAPTIELQNRISPPSKLILKLMSEVTPTAKIPGLLNLGFARALQGEQKDTPEHTTVYFPRMTARFTHELIQAVYRANISFLKFEGPVLFLCPGNDAICSYPAIRKKVATHKNNNVKIKDIEDVGHQVFTEGDDSRRRALAVILPWMEMLRNVDTPPVDQKETETEAVEKTDTGKEQKQSNTEKGDMDVFDPGILN